LSRRAAVTVVAAALVASVGCSKMGKLTGMKNYKEANQAYQQQDYKRAADSYELTVQAAPDDPDLAPAYFYLANSYDNLYKPSKKWREGERRPAGKGRPKLPEGRGKAGGVGKEGLQGSGQAFAAVSGRVVRRRQAERCGEGRTGGAADDSTRPGRPGELFRVGEDLRGRRRIRNAEDILLKAKEAKPTDPAVYMTLAGY
jgi:hypothetical protein